MVPVSKRVQSNVIDVLFNTCMIFQLLDLRHDVSTLPKYYIVLNDFRRSDKDYKVFIDSIRKNLIDRALIETCTHKFDFKSGESEEYDEDEKYAKRE